MTRDRVGAAPASSRLPRRAAAVDRDSPTPAPGTPRPWSRWWRIRRARRSARTTPRPSVVRKARTRTPRDEHLGIMSSAGTACRRTSRRRSPCSAKPSPVEPSAIARSPRYERARAFPGTREAMRYQSRPGLGTRARCSTGLLYPPSGPAADARMRWSCSARRPTPPPAGHDCGRLCTNRSAACRAMTRGVRLFAVPATRRRAPPARSASLELGRGVPQDAGRQSPGTQGGGRGRPASMRLGAAYETGTGSHGTSPAMAGSESPWTRDTPAPWASRPLYSRRCAAGRAQAWPGFASGVPGRRRDADSPTLRQWMVRPATTRRP